MTWDGAGNHDRIHNFSADASAGIQAQAARFDAEFDDISTALENCQTLTGETTPTANSPMGGFKHTGVAAATSTDNYLRADQSSNQVGIYVRDTNTGVTGVMTASAAVFPTAFTDGQRVTVKVSADGSTSAPRAIKINGLSANIVDNEGSAVPASKMKKDGIFDLIYDASASAFRMITGDNVPFTDTFSAEASAQGVAFTSAGTFTLKWTGFVATTTTSVEFTIAGNIACLNFKNTIQASSNTTTFICGSAEVPTYLRPTGSWTNLFGVQDAGTHQVGRLQITAAGTFSFVSDVANSAFTASGLKGFIGNQTFTYRLD